MKIPIVKKLRKRQQVQIALLQDILIEIMYKIVDQPVLHGGTAIWRCYAGNRFSEDLDFYFNPKMDFQASLGKYLASYGMQIMKYKNTGNVMFCKITDGETEVRLESNVVEFEGSIIRDYEKIDGSPVTVLTLPPEMILKEKFSAYIDRRLIRDIYDIYHLSGMAGLDTIKPDAMEFFMSMDSPDDEPVLKTLIISGAVPTYDAMMRTIKSRFYS